MNCSSGLVLAIVLYMNLFLILRSHGDGLTTCYVCSVTQVILVKRGRLEEISEMPLLPLWV
jgi:hypothetical protein